MRHLRLLILALAAICVLALGAFALVNPPEPPPPPADDEIIIKGGSLDIDCGKNHGDDCMGGNVNKSKPKHKKGGKIVRIELQKQNGDPLCANCTFTKKKDFPDNPPRIVITYRDPKPEDN